VPAHVTQRELSIRGVVLGAVLGIVFAASSVYLGLKVGLTVSASIPVAVLSITLFRWASKAFRLRQATILENNIVQTTGSAGESIAAGVAFTLPSLLLMGFDMEFMRVLLVGLLGGLIGVLMMIPLRQGLIVKEHGKLAFPEGTACADVLIVGEQGGTNAKTVFLGFGVGFFYTFMNLVLKLWADTSTFVVDKVITPLKGATVGFEVSPTMLGVGYIIGPKVSANMLAGGALAFLVLVPLIHFFGDANPDFIYPAGDRLVRDMSAGEIRNNYILFIGAGAVATGGFVALARAIPTIVAAFRRGLGSLQKSGEAGAATTIPRTERDMSMKWVLGGSAALALAIAFAPVLDINPLSAVLIVLFGFFFVTVSSRITGEIGSSSNPISGMTVATLLLTCGLFVAIGWTGIEFKAMALTTAALVCVAASNGGTIAQDLKTGHLVGATPRHQQVSILVGVVASAVVIGGTILLLNDSATTFRGIDHHGARLPAAALAQQTLAGPDGQSYGVAYVHEDLEGLAAGELLVGADDRPVRFTPAPDDAAKQVAVHPHALRVPTAAITTRTTQGPDGATYRVAELAQPIPGTTRGKYLVTQSGEPTFLVDPGVCGTYPYKLDAAKGDVRLPVPADAATELGIDRKPYKVVDLTSATAELPAGHYLVDADGRVAYAASDKVLKYDAPKAQLFRLIIDGTLGGQLPWGLVLIGVFLAFMMELVGVSSLPFAVGLYLPISTSGGIFVGGLVRWWVDRKRGAGSASEAEFSPGMLMASGLIAGGAIAGVGQAIFEGAGVDLSLSSMLGDLAHEETWWPFMWFALLALGLGWVAMKAKTAGMGHAPTGKPE